MIGMDYVRDYDKGYMRGYVRSVMIMMWSMNCQNIIVLIISYMRVV